MRTAVGCFSVLLFVLFAPNAVAEDAAWRLVSSSGEVAVSSQSLVPVAIDPRAALPEGAIVATGANGQAALHRGTERIIVAPGSRITLSPDGRAGTRVRQDVGSALYGVGKGTEPHFEVETPYFSAVVKGAVFTITVGPLGAEVKVSEGAVEVATAWRDAVALVKAGGSARVLGREADQIRLEHGGGVERVVTGHDGVKSNGTGLRTSTEPGAMFGAAASADATTVHANPAAAQSGAGSVQPIAGARSQPVEPSLQSAAGAQAELAGGAHGSVRSGDDASGGSAAAAIDAGAGVRASGEEVAGVVSVERGTHFAQSHASTDALPRSSTASTSISTGGARLPPDFKRAKFSELADGGTAGGLLRSTGVASDFASEQTRKIVGVSRRATERASQKLRSEFPWTQVLLAGFCLVGYIFGSHVLGARRRRSSGELR